ncbi:uncharacterized protein LOC102167874 [Sus scrofa]|uniref:uncharacterized protein LOC102167874 n=1 Tax=Sus scrofa TaxID=9823 RepID=UPI000A2B6E8C|nr:uncharacterized protein LOC102167874 [Sus scrofa]
MFAAAAAATAFSSLATWQRRLLPQRRPHSNGGGGAPSPPRLGPLLSHSDNASSGGGRGCVARRPPPQEHPARGDRREALTLSSVLLLVLPPLPPPPGITRGGSWAGARPGHPGGGREGGFSPALGQAAREEAAVKLGSRPAGGIDDSAGGHGHLEKAGAAAETAFYKVGWGLCSVQRHSGTQAARRSTIWSMANLCGRGRGQRGDLCAGFLLKVTHGPCLTWHWTKQVTWQYVTSKGNGPALAATTSAGPPSYTDTPLTPPWL